MSNENPRISINSIHYSNTMSVLEALQRRIPPDTNAFLTTPFVNANVYGESMGRALNIHEMSELKEAALKIVKEFLRIPAIDTLNREQLQCAIIIFIFNHILSTVQYANVESANDGTARVQNRMDDMNTPYESAYSALVLKRSICCGIADAIDLLCKVMGLESQKWLWPNGGHAYNKVKIGNTWYKVDATFQIGFYPNAKAEEWSTDYLLAATEQPGQSLGLFTRLESYPRDQIEQVKAFLERQGVNFNYTPAPKITIQSVETGLKELINNKPQTEEEKNIDFNNLKLIISRIDNELSSHPQITIYNRSDIVPNQVPRIHYTPSDKKITIQRANYKINIVSLNDRFVVNAETGDNRQHTYITDQFGNIVGTLKRGMINIIGYLGFPSGEIDSDERKTRGGR